MYSVWLNLWESSSTGRRFIEYGPFADLQEAESYSAKLHRKYQEKAIAYTTVRLILAPDPKGHKLEAPV